MSDKSNKDKAATSTEFEKVLHPTPKTVSGNSLEKSINSLIRAEAIKIAQENNDNKNK